MDADAIATGAGGRHPTLPGAITRRVIGLYYEVYNELGFGFLESVYQEALAVVLRDAGLNTTREPTVEVRFRDKVVGEFRPDFIVDDALIVELKAVQSLVPAHTAQVINYLRATRYEVGLLLNFGPRPSFRRLAFSNGRKR